MIIHKLYIGHFGKFHQFTYEFEDGFQVIHGANEFGKTTMMAFIQLMFYGKTSAKKVFYENPRKKYAPWTGEPMSGWVEFTWQEECYRLEKQFGKSAHTDVVKLYRLLDGKEIDLQGKEAGEFFFGLDKTAFERMFFVADNHVFQDKKASEYAFHQLWTEAAGIDTESYANAVKLLEQGKEAIVSKSGKKGSLIELQEEKKLLSRSGMEAEKQFKERERIGKEKAKLMERIQELSCELEEKYREVEEIDLPKSGFGKWLFVLIAIGLLCTGLYLKHAVLLIAAVIFLILFFVINKVQKRREAIAVEVNEEQSDILNESRKQIDSLYEMLESQKVLLEDLSQLEQSLTGNGMVDNPEQLRLRKKKLLEQEQQLQSKYKAFQYALDTLQETKEELQKACSPALNQCVGRYLERLTDGKYTSVFIKEGFDIALFDTESGQYHAWQYFSQSTKEILYLSLRFALVEMLMTKEPVPVFLDDALLSFDIERKQRALEFFEEYGKTHQIILFSCQ